MKCREQMRGWHFHIPYFPAPSPLSTPPLPREEGVWQRYFEICFLISREAIKQALPKPFFSYTVHVNGIPQCLWIPGLHASWRCGMVELHSPGWTHLPKIMVCSANVSLALELRRYLGSIPSPLCSSSSVWVCFLNQKMGFMLASFISKQMDGAWVFL